MTTNTSYTILQAQKTISNLFKYSFIEILYQDYLLYTWIMKAES